jgi:hypothetical protein
LSEDYLPAVPKRGFLFPIPTGTTEASGKASIFSATLAPGLPIQPQRLSLKRFEGQTVDFQFCVEPWGRTWKKTIHVPAGWAELRIVRAIEGLTP